MECHGTHTFDYVIGAQTQSIQTFNMSTWGCMSTFLHFGQLLSLYDVFVRQLVEQDHPTFSFGNHVSCFLKKSEFLLKIWNKLWGPALRVPERKPGWRSTSRCHGDVHRYRSDELIFVNRCDKQQLSMILGNTFASMNTQNHFGTTRDHQGSFWGQARGHQGSFWVWSGWFTCPTVLKNAWLHPNPRKPINKYFTEIPLGALGVRAVGDERISTRPISRISHRALHYVRISYASEKRKREHPWTTKHRLGSWGVQGPLRGHLCTS